MYYLKMTFYIPAPLAVRFKAAVPRGQRSPLVSRLLALEIKSAESDLAAACEKANSLKLDMKDWENLNESETWLDLVGEPGPHPRPGNQETPSVRDSVGRLAQSKAVNAARRSFE